MPVARSPGRTAPDAMAARGARIRPDVTSTASSSSRWCVTDIFADRRAVGRPDIQRGLTAADGWGRRRGPAQYQPAVAQLLPDQLLPDQLLPDHDDPDQLFPDQLLPVQTEPFHVPPVQARPAFSRIPIADALNDFPKMSCSPFR